MKQTFFNRINFIIRNMFDRLTSKTYARLRKVKILNTPSTIEEIIKHRYSISRFGDGEFTLMSGIDTGFQEYNASIGRKLREIIKNDTAGLKVCIPYVWKNPWNLKYQPFEYWSAYLNSQFLKNVYPYLTTQSVYYDTQFTRFYMDYRNSKYTEKTVALLKQIWGG